MDMNILWIFLYVIPWNFNVVTAYKECNAGQEDPYYYTTAIAPEGVLCLSCRDGRFFKEVDDDALGEAQPCAECSEPSHAPNGAKTACTRCAIGYYDYVDEITPCTQCPSGSTTISVGSDGDSSCFCDVGYYGPNGGPCTPCPDGTTTYTQGYNFDNDPNNIGDGIGLSELSHCVGFCDAEEIVMSPLDPCNNNGHCVDDPDSYRCDCFAGWTGTNCQDQGGVCDPNPCQNEGACAEETGGYRCECPSTWMGTNCTEDVNECDDPAFVDNCPNCQNVPAGGGATCDCEAGKEYISGEGCKDANDCEPNPCNNGGSCTDLGLLLYECACNPGFTGTTCDTDIDECTESDPYVCCDDTTSSKCGTDTGAEQVGTCTNTNGGYICTCNQGFEKNAMQQCTEKDECASDPCMNGGTCTDAINSFTCFCATGWTGTVCETAFTCGMAQFSVLNSLTISPDGTADVPTGTAYDVTCNAGYHIDGTNPIEDSSDGTVECLEDGTWDNKVSCVRT